MVASASADDFLFRDGFDNDLSGWDLVGERSIEIRDSGDPEFGRVLALTPDSTVLALIRGSEAWGPVAIECDFLFPDDASNYLGVIYNFTESESGRTDFGSLYIKGNGSYVRANPWRDGNVSRLLYEEYKTPIAGDDAIEIDRWSRLRAEVIGEEIHLYIGDMSRPKVTFDLYEGDSGQIGFNPRVTGWPVWIDNVDVRAIEEFSYQGPAIPKIEYDRTALLTDWQVAGPFASPDPGLERRSNERLQGEDPGTPPTGWIPFETDRRGTVVTGRITEYDGPRPVAYFRTVVTSETDREATLHLSTTDELSLWINTTYDGFVYRNGYVFGERDWNAWHDFWKNPEHEAARVPIKLRAGKNEILLRVRNGQFASGGFFARLE